MKTYTFAEIVRRTLEARGDISKQLITHAAVVLERPKHGGGATDWYFCQSEPQLRDVENALSPGSVVSFYFDNRIERQAYSPSLRPTLEEIIADTGDVVLGFLQDDGLHLSLEVVDNPLELGEFLSSVDDGTEVFFGAFPARDDDGVHAVTLVLPDEDGVVRAYPH